MPPNRPKLFKNKNHTKPANGIQQNLSQPSTSTSTEVPIPNQEQFEVELCWCIQQLQLGLNSGKLNKKQVQDHTKALNVLMSNTAPVVKKRQVMRMSFGDYREKMAEEEKRVSKHAANMKFKPATPNKKTVFLKKSLFNSSEGNPFKFNFNIEDIVNENGAASTSIDKVSEKPNDCNEFHYTPSNNSFKFDFQIESEDN